MRRISKAGLHNLALVFSTGDEDSERGSSLRVLRRCVHANAIGENNIRFPRRSSRQLHRFPCHIGEVITHVINHPAPFVSHTDQRLANGFATPAGTHVRDLGTLQLDEAGRLEVALFYPFDELVAGDYRYTVEVRWQGERTRTRAPARYTVRPMAWFA